MFSLNYKVIHAGLAVVCFFLVQCFLPTTVMAVNNQSAAIQELLSSSVERGVSTASTAAPEPVPAAAQKVVSRPSVNDAAAPVSPPPANNTKNIKPPVNVNAKPSPQAKKNTPVKVTSTTTATAKPSAVQTDMRAIMPDQPEGAVVDKKSSQPVIDPAASLKQEAPGEVLEFAPDQQPVILDQGDAALSLEQQAFANILKTNVPLTPDQIRQLRTLFDQSQRAAAAYPGSPPKPTSTSIMINLSPGATPPVIRLRSGYVSSLVFVDSTGESWPVVAYDLGDPESFNIQPTELDGKNNTILIQALTNHKTGNLAVMLKGQNTPIMITLLTGQSSVDYRVDMRVPGLGPNAKPYFNGLPSVGNKKLLSFLDGVPPQGSKTLKLEGADAQGWLYQDNIYIRTRLTLLSPSWLATMSSPDGTRVYELVKTPLVLMSHHGRVNRVMIKGME